MARDILAVVVLIIALEVAFSTGNRVLDAYRSSLSSKIVQAIILLKPISIEKDLSEIEIFDQELTKLGVDSTIINFDWTTLGLLDLVFHMKNKDGCNGGSAADHGFPIMSVIVWPTGYRVPSNAAWEALFLSARVYHESMASSVHKVVWVDLKGSATPHHRQRKKQFHFKAAGHDQETVRRSSSLGSEGLVGYPTRGPSISIFVPICAKAFSNLVHRVGGGSSKLVTTRCVNQVDSMVVRASIWVEDHLEKSEIVSARMCHRLNVRHLLVSSVSRWWLNMQSDTKVATLLVGGSWNEEARVPLKVRMFACKIYKNALPMVYNLRKRGVEVKEGCALCDGEEEIVLTALVWCLFARLAWAPFCHG
ncbi:UNVERIFIED_CONTAM: hypothetical protein Scaly_2600600 [Sesamum calycinum]|uniref:Uncharacterized protein n=1 Tax=Sesamum calycinum TaxID=2727403 RepID=A0AAW2JBW2_9LAMI